MGLDLWIATKRNVLFVFSYHPKNTEISVGHNISFSLLIKSSEYNLRKKLKRIKNKELLWKN